MTAISDLDYGTPARVSERDRHARDRRPAGVRPRGHLGDARRRWSRVAGFRSCAPPTTSRRSAPAGCASSRSRAARAIPASCTTPAERHEGPHPDAEAGRAAPRRDGAVHLRSPARLPHLFGQRRLRAAGHGRRGRPARGPLRLRGRRTTSTSPKDDVATPTSPSIPSKCIVCSRCVRACDEVQGTLRAHHRRAAASTRWCRPARTSRSWSRSACRCGACVQACPTATLHGEHRHRATARPTAA